MRGLQVGGGFGLPMRGGGGGGMGGAAARSGPGDLTGFPCRLVPDDQQMSSLSKQQQAHIVIILEALCRIGLTR